MKHCDSVSLFASAPGGPDSCHSLSGLFFKLPLPGAVGNGPVWVPGANVQMGLSQRQPSKRKPECTARSPAGAGRVMERRPCHHKRTSLERDVPRDPAPASMSIVLTAAHHLRLQKQVHRMRAMSADLQDRQTSRQDLRSLRTPPRGRLGTGGTLGHTEARTPPSSHRGHRRGTIQ